MQVAVSAAGGAAGGLADGFAVSVPRELLREVLMDGCCPLHLRLQLQRALVEQSPCGAASSAAAGRSSAEASAAKAPATAEPSVEEQPEGKQESSASAGGSNGDDSASGTGADGGRMLADLDPSYLSGVAAYLPLEEVLTTRACSREPLQWAMQRSASQEHGPQHWVHDRIRTRLWMRRIADLTQGTKDESVFETRMRNLADEALRSRMEKEMQEALAQMEEHIRAFQAEVDRRLAEQEQHVRRLVEERVQQELDTILASEVVKVQAMVEERVRERVNAVSTVFRREVRETVRELQAKLDELVEENDLLRDAFSEANLRAKRTFWALHPPPLQLAASAGIGLQHSSLFSSLRRRLELSHT